MAEEQSILVARYTQVIALYYVYAYNNMAI
jgi:hypothetical protein